MTVDDYQHLRESADAATLAASPTLAESYDPGPADDARYETAIARRFTALANYREATGLLDAVVARGVRDPDLRPYIQNVNEAQHELEHAERDLIRERVVWREHRREGRR